MNSIFYEKVLKLDEFSKSDLIDLSQTRFLIIGAGGIAHPLVINLLGHGVKHLSIADGDIVETDKLFLHKWLAKLGPEPLGNNFFPEVLKDALTRKKSQVKTALLDQKVLAGLGNIYVCEVLWKARISPYRLCHQIRDFEYEFLVTSIREILRKAIKAGGSSLRDFKNVGGDLGYFQNNFSVYAQEGNPVSYTHLTLPTKRIV